MISPKSAKLILRHFDEIDKHVSKRLLRKRPWSEPALTSVLCDLLDKDTQIDEGLEYHVGKLNSDLLKSGDPLFFSMRIETHEYGPKVERYISQSDIGIIFDYRNQFTNNSSWTKGWLLQAKRIFPEKNTSSHSISNKSSTNPVYTQRSRFDSFDKEQHERIQRLEKHLGGDFIRYLLYTPRPQELDEGLRSLLSYRRIESVGNNIFDYLKGLQLRDDLLSDDSSIEAGIFVCDTGSFPKNYEEVHRKIFHGTTPFSWFFLEHFFRGGKSRMDKESQVKSDEKCILELVKGNACVLDDIFSDNIGRIPILPAHTLIITAITGLDVPERNNLIQ